MHMHIQLVLEGGPDQHVAHTGSMYYVPICDMAI